VWKCKRTELYHHGILGQKWGIRRFQNPDGSLTPEGRERYGSAVTKVMKTGHISIPDEYYPTKKDVNKAKKTIDSMRPDVPDSIRDMYANCMASYMKMPKEYQDAIDEIEDEVVNPVLIDNLTKDVDTINNTNLNAWTMMSTVYSWGIFCNIYSEMTETE
jgi:hypothetical protein